MQTTTKLVYKRLVKIPLNAVGEPIYEERWIYCDATDPGAVPVGVQACRPEDRAMLATEAGQELIRAAVAQLAKEISDGL